MPSFKGYLELPGRLADLVTVFDMCGWGARIRQDGALVSEDSGVLLQISPEAGRFHVSGSVDQSVIDPVTALTRLTLALEADGVGFRLTLLSEAGEHMHTFEPVG